MANSLDCEALPSTSQSTGESLTKGTTHDLSGVMYLPTPLHSLVIHLSPLFFLDVFCRAHISELVRKYNAFLIKEQDAILEKFFGHNLCEKLYRYTHLVNGVAIMLTHDEVCTSALLAYSSNQSICHHVCALF